MNISLKPLDQQVMVITGASSGIGLATALAAAQHGTKLVLAARSGELLERIAEKIALSEGQIATVQADVGERSDVERIAATAIERFGRIDTWVNDAGVAIYGRLDEVSEQGQPAPVPDQFLGCRVRLARGAATPSCFGRRRARQPRQRGLGCGGAFAGHVLGEQARRQRLY